MVSKVVQVAKQLLYFPLANYFRFFGNIRLRKWQPRVIAITGSSGKTTLLNLVAARLGSKAKYSFHANSSFGIPFNLLDLERKTLTIWEWPSLFLLAPFRAFRPPPKEKLYVVEVDCDRPGEGKFLGELLRPEVTLWITSSRTHSMNFDYLVGKGSFTSVDEAIAHEFGDFVIRTQKLVIANGDSRQIRSQMKRITVEVEKVSCKRSLKSYSVGKSGTEYKTNKGIFNFPFLLPKEFCVSLLSSFSLMDYLGLEVGEKGFENFRLPPGRSSLFKGVKGTTIVDSTYNANLASMVAILNMFDKLKAERKWVVLGDMLEQGELTQEEHEKLAKTIKKIKLERVILMGPRISEYTYPLLKDLEEKSIVLKKFLKPKEVLDYVEKEISGSETILFKGARFLDGVIEYLLLDKSDTHKLPRREKIWKIRRKQWGL